MHERATTPPPPPRPAERERHILVCGWRHEWSHNPVELKTRLLEIGQGLPPGSTVTIVCLKSSAEMHRILTATHHGESGGIFEEVEAGRKSAPFRGRVPTARADEDHESGDEDGNANAKADGLSRGYGIAGDPSGLRLFSFTGDAADFDDLHDIFQLR